MNNTNPTGPAGRSFRPSQSTSAGIFSRKIEQAYNEGFQDATREARARQLTGAAASALAITLFNVGRKRGWW